MSHDDRDAIIFKMSCPTTCIHTSPKATALAPMLFGRTAKRKGRRQATDATLAKTSLHLNMVGSLVGSTPI